MQRLTRFKLLLPRASTHSCRCPTAKARALLSDATKAKAQQQPMQILISWLN
jgi:hypothetical protein